MKGTNEKIFFLEKRHSRFNFILSFLFLTFLFLTAHSVPLETDGVCHTEVCNETATTFLNNMDPTVHPCDDFYQYACGNFIKNVAFPYNLPMTNSLGIVQGEIFEKMNRTLSTDINENDGKLLQLLKTHHRACLELSVETYPKIVRTINSFGGWPTLHGHYGFEWNETRFDWMKMAENLTKLGVLESSFFQIDFSSNDSIRISPGTERLIKDLSSFLHDYLEVDEKLAEEDVVDVRKLIDELNGIISKNPQEQTMTIRELETKFPGIRWLEYIRAVAPFTVDENQTILVNDLSYTSNVTGLLERQKKRTIANYILFKLTETWYNFVKVRHMVKNTFEPWYQCIAQAQIDLPMAFSSVYIREYFSREIDPSNDVRDILRHVNEQFVNIFQKSTWMDDGLKQHALAKLAAIWPHIAYPKELLNNQKVEEYYESIKLSGDSFFEIFHKALKIVLEKRSHSHPDKRHWTRYEKFAEANALNIHGISILIPASVMHGSIFDKDRPKYANYGALGWTVAHEIGHTFDTQYFPIDQYDNKYPLHWNAVMIENWMKILDHFKSIYNNYTIKEINEKVNGNRTLQENIADFLGLKAAYNAYKQWVEEHGDEPRLPGIDRSPKQLFWLSAANLWCTKCDSKFLRNKVMKDDHAPGEARVINSFKNMPEFAEDYQCPEGSNMSPFPDIPGF